MLYSLKIAHCEAECFGEGSEQGNKQGDGYSVSWVLVRSICGRQEKKKARVKYVIYGD